MQGGKQRTHPPPSLSFSLSLFLSHGVSVLLDPLVVLSDRAGGSPTFDQEGSAGFCNLEKSIQYRE